MRNLNIDSTVDLQLVDDFVFELTKLVPVPVFQELKSVLKALASRNIPDYDDENRKDERQYEVVLEASILRKGTHKVFVVPYIP